MRNITIYLIFEYSIAMVSIIDLPIFSTSFDFHPNLTYSNEINLKLSPPFSTQHPLYAGCKLTERIELILVPIRQFNALVKLRSDIQRPGIFCSIVVPNRLPLSRMAFLIHDLAAGYINLENFCS